MSYLKEYGIKMTNLMRKHLESIKNISGCFAEFGVFRGDTFQKLLPIANNQDKFIYGVDSFCGMDKPTEKDNGYYPQGKLNSGGYKILAEVCEKMGYKWGYDFILYKGFIPKIFESIPEYDISFIYIDLDHYRPTIETFAKLFPNVSENGLILFDDYIEKYDILASLAIKEILEEYKGLYKIEEKNIRLIEGGCKTQLLIRKTI